MTLKQGEVRFKLYALKLTPCFLLIHSHHLTKVTTVKIDVKNFFVDLFFLETFFKKLRLWTLSKHEDPK